MNIYQKINLNYHKLSFETILKLLIAIAIIPNVLGLFPSLMDQDDNTLYANIAKTIVEKNDWINLYVNGKDWLDKPHFQFWITAMFYKIFGFNSFAYRFSSFLFFIMGLIYTYYLAKKLLENTIEPSHKKLNIIALLSVFILVTAQYIVISNVDVRAEMYLFGLLVASVYHIIRRNESVWHILLAALFMGCALMTKGVYVLIPVLSLWFLDEVFKKKFFFFLHWKFILFLCLCIVFMSPELICLYLQFDTHPEKIIFEKTNVSGLQFFFWDSQFGRFTNTAPITRENGDIFFFLHTMLWVYFPWCLLFYWSCIQEGKKLFKDNMIFKLFAIFIPMFLIFSISKFQLPHYMIILFPYFSILIAKYMVNSSFFETGKKQIFYTLTQIYLLAILLLVGGLAILFYGFQTKVFFILVANLIIIILFLGLWRKLNFKKFILQATLSSLFLNLFLLLQLYPDFLDYQYSYKVNQYILQPENHIPKLIVPNNLNTHGLQFYSHQNIEVQETILNSKDTIFVLCDLPTKQQLQDSFFFIQSFPNYSVSKLNIQFLNHNTRTSILDSVYIMSNQRIDDVLK